MSFTFGVWFAAIIAVIVGSVATGAVPSTSALLLFVLVVPLGIVLLIGFDAPPPRVSELLHAVTTDKERRR